MDLQLDNKLAFISGSSKGIGKSVAELLLKEGAEVIINGRSDLEPILNDLSQYGTVHGIQADLSDENDMQRLLDEIDAIGDLDILVNNLGIFQPKPFLEIEDEDWTEMFNVNIMSTVKLSRHFFPGMMERDYGRIINISSEAGIRGLESMVHYSMTKGAQVVIGRGMANLTKDAGNVTVNSVLPGPTMTEGVEQWLKESAEVEGMEREAFVKQFFEDTEPNSLIQRFIEPEEIASVVTFLSSPISTAVNGASIRAEGGLIKSIV